MGSDATIDTALLQGTANLLRLGGLAWLLALGWGTGRLLVRRFPLACPAAERAVLSIGLGLGAISLLVLGWGLTVGYRPAALGALLALLTAVTLGGLAFAPPRRAPEARSPEGSGAAARILVGAGAVFAAVAALAPPLFYDALVYHLGVPNLFLLRGRFEQLPHVVYSNFPLGAEMLSLLGLFLGGPELAGLLNFAFAPLAALALAALVRPRWGARPAEVAAALFLLSPPVLLLSRYATVELPMTFYALLTYSCLLRWSEGEEEPALLLAGVFAGLSLSTKYVGGLFAILAPAAVLLFRRPRALLPFLAAACLTAAPWLIKNLLLTGNPVFPAFPGLLGGSGWSPEQAAALDVDAHAAWVAAASWRDWLSLPFDIVLNRRDLGAAAQGGWIWIPFAAGAAFTALRRKDRAERLLLALFLACGLLWAASFWMARFLLPALALGAILAALALERSRAGRRPGAPGVALALFLSCSLATILADGAVRRPLVDALLPALGLRTRESYLRSNLRIHPAVELINRQLPRDARILLLGDAKAAYLRRDHLYATVLDRPLLPGLIGSATDPGEVQDALQRSGITHVLLNAQELERTERQYPASRTPAPTLRALQGFLEARCRLLLAGNGVFLFELPGPATRGGRAPS